VCNNQGNAQGKIEANHRRGGSTGQPFAAWNSPERIMVNTHAQYRHYAGRTGHPGKYRTLNIMRRQALLAQEMPDAQPRVMRRP